MRANLIKLGWVCAGWALTQGAGASDSAKAVPIATAATASVSFKGFATLGAAWFSRADVGVVSNFRQRQPVTDEGSFDLDSIIGGQLNWRATAGDTLVVQGVARAGDDKIPRLSLGFWEHRFDMGLKLRAGRLGLPVFRDSDVINIGYANLTARPPLPVYMRINSFQILDGLDLSHRFDWGESAITARVFGGSTATHYRVYGPGSSDVNASIRGLKGVALGLQHGRLSLRVSHSASPLQTPSSSDLSNIDDHVTQLIQALQAMGRGSQAQALQAYVHQGDGSVAYTSLGAEWISSDWQVISEWTRTANRRDTIGHADAWHLTLARTWGQLAPYVFVSGVSTRQRALDASAFVPTGQPMVDAGLAWTYDGLNTLRETTRQSLRAKGLGIRYDHNANLALKIQIERLEGQTPGTLVPKTQRPAGPVSGQLISVTADMVF